MHETMHCPAAQAPPDRSGIQTIATAPESCKIESYFTESALQSAYRPVAAFGSSSTEVFDYIFGNSAFYHPMWASGWAGRSLRREEPGGFLATIADPLPRETILLLNFGATDLNFNLPYKVRESGFYDFAGFLDQLAASIGTAHDLYKSLGFTEVHAVFVSPVVALHRNYWAKRELPFLPPPLLGQMYLDLVDKVAAAGVPVINPAPRMVAGPKRPVLAPRLARDTPNHHASYIATQDMIWQSMQHLPGLPPRRDPAHTGHYAHQPYSITTWKMTGEARPRTTQ